LAPATTVKHKTINVNVTKLKLDFVISHDTHYYSATKNVD